MKKIIFMAFAAAVLASCDKHNSSSNEVVYENSSFSGASYDRFQSSAYSDLTSVYYEEVCPTDVEEYLTEIFSSSNYTIQNSGDKEFTVSDMDGNYYHVSVDEYGNVTAYDFNGNFYRSSTDGCGNTTGFDSNGNFYHSYTDDYGNTTAFDSDGNFYHSYTDDFGNTTGFDSNGNIYSAHTDDFGNTTISIF